MISLIVRITFALLVLNHLFTPCVGLRSSEGRAFSEKSGKGYKDPAITNTPGAGVPSPKTSRRGLGISAWGIIMLIVTLVLAGMGFYYFSMCYPILCKKERNYDIIELANV